MRNQGLRNAVKKAVAGSLTAMLVVSGLTLVPEATETTAGSTVFYEEVTDTSKYWTAAQKTAPVKDGYVFGGWYDGDKGDALTEVDGSAYAKWVPATVLSVKTQSLASGDGAITDSGNKPDTTDLRLLSAVDSTDYRYCGFELLYGEAEKTPASETHITKVYKAIAFEDGTTLKAEETFGTGAEYFFALNISTIYQNSFASKIYVRPYWVTLDGTTVYGLAKNVRVEDHYSDYDYYSLSVNLFGGQAIAAGMVTVTYDTTKFEVVSGEKGIETGRVLKEMDWKDNNGTITIVGNGATVNGSEKADGLFANIRLKQKEHIEDIPTLKIEEGSTFCNWSEEMVTVTGIAAK